MLHFVRCEPGKAYLHSPLNRDRHLGKGLEYNLVEARASSALRAIWTLRFPH